MKNFLKSFPLVNSLVYRARYYHKRYLKKEEDFGSLTDGEILLFKAIKKDIRNLFDVGARYDTDYIELGGDDIAFYLFEPNPIFFKRLRKKVSELTPYKSLISIFNFGFSDQECDLVYYKDTQSFVKVQQMIESKIPGPKLKIKTITGFCKEQHIDFVDFLKTDVESLDYHVLLGGKELIQNTCKYCQFELGIGADLEDEKVGPQHYYKFFEDKFTLYLVRDENHPIYRDYPNLPILAKYTKKLRETLERYIYDGYGVNLFAVRNNIDLPSELIDLMNLKDSTTLLK